MDQTDRHMDQIDRLTDQTVGLADTLDRLRYERKK